MYEKPNFRAYTGSWIGFLHVPARTVEIYEKEEEWDRTGRGNKIVPRIGLSALLW